MVIFEQVGFCDLVKKAKDQKNELWVAEATENSSYFLSFDFPRCSHLKSAAASVQRISSLVCITKKTRH